MLTHAVTHNAVFIVISRFRTWCTFVGCWLVSVNGIAQQVFVAPVVRPVPVNRIQAPGYIPPPPVVRRPWWFTVQTVSGPGAVVPVPRVTRYQPQPFRFPPAAPVLAGKPITPPTSTFPSQWAAAPPITPSSPITQKTVPAPPSSWQPSIPLPREEAKPTPPKPNTFIPPPQSTPAQTTPPPPSGNWATIAVDASNPQPNAMAITIPPESGGTLAAQPHHNNTPQKTPIPAQTVSTPQVQSPVPVATPAATVAWWRCTGVTDGDTITCLDAAGQQQKVQVSDIDAPELSQPYGRESRNILADLVFGKSLAIIETGSNSNGFVTCRISVGGKDVARAMITGGAAWVDPQSTSPYINDQQDAQKSGKGLWSEPTPTPPWEYRKSAVTPWQQAA